jgi:hypothetical protein
VVLIQDSIGVAYLLSRDEQASQSNKAVSQAVVLDPPDIWNLSNPVALPAPEILPSGLPPLYETGRPPTDLNNQDKAEPRSLSGEDTTSRHSHWYQSEEEAALSEGFVQV